MASPTRSVFVSYVRSDADFALQLARDLKASGVAAWIDQIDIPAGDRWDAAIERALSHSECVVVVLSRASVLSANVMDEVSFALDEQKRVLPVLVEECPVPMRLRRLQFIDFSSKHQEALARLLDALGAAPAANTEPPPIRPRSEATVLQAGASEPRSAGETPTRLFTPPAVAAAPRISNEVLRRVYLGALIVAAIAAAGIYVVFERSIGETQMVRLSYYWVPLVAFGISGLTLTRDSLVKSLVVGALAVPLLGFFFSSVFDRL